MLQPLWKTVWCFLTKLNILLPYNLRMSFLGIYLKEVKTYLHKSTCIWMLVAALFIITKTEINHQSSVGEQVHKLQYIQIVKSLICVRLFATPWTGAHQAPPSMGFSRQEYWSGLPFPSPGDLPDPGIEPRSPALQADALTSEPPGKPSTSR